MACLNGSGSFRPRASQIQNNAAEIIHSRRSTGDVANYDVDCSCLNNSTECNAP
jgi:hypothetical protein